MSIQQVDIQLNPFSDLVAGVGVEGGPARARARVFVCICV